MDFRRLAGTTALAAVSVCCASAEDIKLPGDWRGSIHGFGLVNYSARPDFEASPGGDGLGEHGFLLADQRGICKTPARWGQRAYRTAEIARIPVGRVPPHGVREGFCKSLQRVQLKLEAHSPKGAASLLAKPEFYYDAVAQEFGADLREAYLDFMRQGGERWAGNHTFHRETIKAVINDPEYQCQNPKGRGSQLCFTNPKLVRQVAQMARDYFDGKGGLPAGWKALGDYFALVPDDNMNLCDCKMCKALLQKGASRKTGQFSSGEMSDYWFAFVNAVAREVRRTHPDKYIATLAYWAYALPPGFELEPNVSIAPCLHTCTYAIHPEMRENDLQLYRQWQEKSKAPMFLWVYYHHPMEPALIDGWKCFPNVMVHATAKAMRMFIRDGVRGIFECGEQDQLEQYVMAKVWDDPDVDVDGLMDEFFRLYFGAAGEPMKRFYLRLEEIACDPSNYPPPYRRNDRIDWKAAAWERLGTAKRMEELGALMAQAEKLAGTKTEKQRVALWRTAIWEWMREGREQHASPQRK